MSGRDIPTRAFADLDAAGDACSDMPDGAWMDAMTAHAGRIARRHGLRLSGRSLLELWLDRLSSTTIDLEGGAE